MNVGVIWDMDGTLVDTAVLHLKAWKRLGDELGRPFTDQDFADTFGKRNPEIIRPIFGDHLTDGEVTELGERKENYYREDARHGIELLPGARALLEGFNEFGVPQAIGSSAPRRNLELILELTGTFSLFDAIVSAEDVTHGKPHPEVFVRAADKLGIEPTNCVVFEDAVAGVQAAKAGGMVCVAVRFVGHHSAEALDKAGADRVVECLTEVTVRELLERVKREEWI